jgi:hypothetical protein
VRGVDQVVVTSRANVTKATQNLRFCNRLIELSFLDKITRCPIVLPNIVRKTASVTQVAE